MAPEIRELGENMSFLALVAPINVNVKQYGATGNGTTDDTAAIQAAINTAATTPGSIVFFPAGTYIVSSTITFPGNISLVGSGDNDSGTIIRVKAGTNLATPVLASSDWNNNATTCGNPVAIRDLKIDGNSATTGANAHGLVSMNFWSIFERISIINVAGDGFLFTAHSQNGTHITNTCVEPKISRLQVRSVGGNGIHVRDSASPLNSCTDGFLQDCIVTATGARGIYVEMGPGWIVTGNHVYTTVTDAIIVSRCFATRVAFNYVDGYGSGSSTFIAGIGMDVSDGRGSSCIGNHIGFEGGAATGPYQAIRITGAGSAAAVCLVTNNTVKGGNQSGSLGYVIQTNVSQQSSTWTVYFHDNDAFNVATYLAEDSFVTGGNMTVLGHLGSAGLAVTAAAGANAGTTPPAPVLTRATDLSGKITFGTGTTPAAGAMAVVTFNVAYPNPPCVVICPLNAASASLNLWVDRTATNFTVSAVNAPSAAQANTTYGFFYHVFI